MVSVTWRLVTGVTETAGGGGAPWAAATQQETMKLSVQATTFQATELRPGIELLLTVGRCSLGTLPLRANLYPCKTAIHKQFRYRDVALLLLAMFGHAGPIDVNLDVGPGMLRVFLGLEIDSRKACSRAALMCCSLRCAKLGDASAETVRASPRAIAAIRLFPIVTVSLLDSKSLPIHKPA